jgi:alkylation response protein AidB-like acyl-CoA dehydrogenase
LHEARLGELAVELIALTELEEKYVRNWAAGGSKEGPEASLLKIRGTEILQGLTELALEIQGPFGAVHNPADLHYSGDGPLSAAQHASIMAHQYLYGRCWSIFGGTNEIQRNIIAKSLLS